MNIFKTILFAALAATPAWGNESAGEVAERELAERNLAIECSVVRRRLTESNVNSGEAQEIFVEGNRDLVAWSLDFVRVCSNFGVSSDEELVLVYEAFGNNTFVSNLFAGDCESNITNITVTPSPIDYNSTTGELVLGYNFNKSQIAGSNIWNATTGEIEVCQVVQSILPPNMVIKEDKRVLTIDFDLNVEYNISGVGLAPETINANDTDSDVDSYIESCKCSKDSYACTTDPVAPNEQIYLCIYSKSAVVGITELVSMTIDQTSTKSPGTVGTIQVIVGGDVVFTEITKETECAAGACGNAIEGEGRKVSTYLPIDLFDYETGTTVSASGTVDTGLVRADSAFSRKLSAGTGRKLEESKSAAFAMDVTLTTDEVTAEDSINSASAVGKGITGLALMYAIVTAMW